MATQITWHGHSNMQVTSGGLSVLVDPFFFGNPVCGYEWNEAPAPDVVLVTHDHGDHVGDAVDICRGSKAVCCCVYDTAQVLVNQGLPVNRLAAAFNMGGTVTVRGAAITMTPASHTSESGAPAGYVVRMPDAFTFYHAGDTALFGDMALIGEYHELDVALLPIGGMYTMDPKQAVHACRLLRPKQVIPMHYGTFPQLIQKPDTFVALMAEQLPDIAVRVMRPGQTLTID